MPVRMELMDGDCDMNLDYETVEAMEEFAENERMEEPTTERSMDKSNVLNLGQHTIIKNATDDLEGETPIVVKNTTEIIELGQHVIISNKTAQPETTTSKVTQFPTTEPWRPITKQMILEVLNGKFQKNDTKIDEEKFLNYGERIPKKTKTEKRSFDNYDLESSIAGNYIPVGPLSTTSSLPELSLDLELDKESEKANEEMEKLVTVQLFPVKLADVFERAEKYARFTLFPLISDTFLNLFNGRSNTENPPDNQETPIILERISNDHSYKSNEEFDDKIIKNYNFLQKSGNALDEISKPIEKIGKKNVTDLAIRINLPTYRPESEKPVKPKFIPISNRQTND